MNEPLISVIVPVYNVENYLRECLESIRNQTYRNLEVFLINDGSTDNSGIICEEYAAKDNRFTVIHQENAGASSARNRGIESAIGKWITFIDADDYVESNYLETLAKHIAKENDVLIIQGLKQVNINGEKTDRVEFPTTTLHNNEIEKAFREMSIFNYGYSVAKLYNKKIAFNIMKAIFYYINIL